MIKLEDEIEFIGHSEWLRRLAGNLEGTPNTVMRHRLLECADEIDNLNETIDQMWIELEAQVNR